MEGVLNPNPPFFIGLSNLYLLLSNTLISKMGIANDTLNVDIPEDTRTILKNFLDAVEDAEKEDVMGLRSSLCRKDLDRSTRTLWEDTLKQFYGRYGYGFREGYINADHLAVKLAFISYLFRESADALSTKDEERFRERLVVIHRFINVHIIPMIRDCDSNIIKSIKPLISFTIGILRSFIMDKRN